MLPSRGLARSPASALRYSFSSRTKPTGTISTRQFSQAQPQSRSSALSRHALCRGNTSRPGQIASSVSTIGYGTSIGIASSVFAQRSGAARTLSLWPFSKSQDTQKKDILSEASAPPPTDAQPAVAEASGVYEPVEPVESVEPVEPVKPVKPVEAANFDNVPPPTTHETDPSRLPDDLLREFDTQSLLDIPERIGFLREFGLDYGYGPASCCQWLLEHIHIYSGMPWWGSIAAVAVLFRVVLFYPTITAAKHHALLQKAHASPAFIQAKSDFTEATFRTNDQTAMMMARSRMSQITRQSGASLWRPFIGLVLIPFSFGMFRLVRGMASVPIPGLETGGFAWFPDLTVHDPLYILPIGAIVLTTLTLKQTQRARISDPTQDAIMGVMLYAMPPVMFLGTAWLPAAIQWFFAVMSAGTVVQSSAAINPAIRRWVGLPPLLPGGGIGPFPGSGVQYQSPTERVIPTTFRESMSAAGRKMKEAAGATPEKVRWQKAKEYEEKRAEEERQKAMRRMEEARRRRIARRQAT